MKKKTAIAIITVGFFLISILVVHCVISAMPTTTETSQTEIETVSANDDTYSMVDGISMYPTLDDNDILVVHKGETPEYHDIVVFMHEDEKFVKRVIGLPGDTIEIKDGDVYRNGIKEELFSDLETNQYNIREEITVEAGHYFVLGDNRNSSYDSRHFGSIAEEDIIGTAEKADF